MMITALDSHVHIWNRSHGETFIAEAEFPVLTGKSFMPEDLEPVLRETNAAQAVLVHGPANVAHSRYCLELCRDHGMFRSVIGWVDLRDGNSADLQIDRYSKDPNFRGIRLTPMLDPDPEGYLRSDAARNVARRLAQRGQVLEILAPVALLPAAFDLGRTVPEVTLVIAHFGLPTGEKDGFEPWDAAMKALSDLPRSHVKISGLPLTGRTDADIQMTHHHLLPLLERFGPERLLYASNWPVATALATPRHWRGVLGKVMDQIHIPAAQQHEIMSRNAESIY